MINSISSNAAGCCSYIRAKICECFEKPERRIDIHTTSSADGMRRPGPRTERLSELKELMGSGDIDISEINGVLKGLAESPITVMDTLILSGTLDPALSFTGTDLRHNLLPYILNPNAIRKFTFVGASFRRSTIERCALEIIKKLNAIYAAVPTKDIELNIIGHSMGARIAENVLQLINSYPDLCVKNFIFKKMISINGANKGSDVARISNAILCCSDYISKDLIPEAVAESDKEFGELETVARYYAVTNDPLVKPDLAAPPGRPMLVLSGISRFTPHTATLNDPLVKLHLLKWMQIKA